ncbi:MAG: TlyA family RNA methyltransferase [Candidatus Izemoplasma sp.]
MRLDQYLVQEDYFETRNQAQQEIKNKCIKVNGKLITKSSYKVEQGVNIEVINVFNPYVSKGGLKLEKALRSFNIDLKNKNLLDIGSSTGGFIDCALKNGVNRIYGVDVGTNQIDPRLIHNENLTVYERTNFLDVSTSLFDVDFDYASIDVSFISSSKIMEHLYALYPEITTILLLKPQFETSKEINKTGVIKDIKIHMKVLENTYKYLKAMNLYVNNVTYSPNKGGSGNIEFLLLISNKKQFVDYKDIVEEAHKVLS